MTQVHVQREEVGFAKKRRRKGFTLIELLVVIVIIAILTTLIITAFAGGGGSQDLDSGVMRWTRVFSLAQSLSITRKTPVRVAICYDPTETDYFLSHANIFYLDQTTGNWQPYSEGENLPPGIFFTPALCTPATVVTPLKVISMSYNFDTFTVASASPVASDLDSDLTGNRDDLNGSGADQWIVYEFNANGTASNPGARMVLTEGAVASGNLIIPNVGMADGFVLFRAGRPYHFQDPDQIQGL